MRLFLSTLLLAVFISGCASKHPPLQTVKSIDLNRYLGTWHEVARYENWFERGCEGATAEYSKENGYISVLNTCLDTNGSKIKSAKGRAYEIEGTDGTKLEVSFFWPFYGDYWVLMLSDDYRYSVIGEPSRKYLWILSRTVELDEKDKTHILSKLGMYGYDSKKLRWPFKDARK